ncbi:hypothetical protein C1H46_035319 [Malus baccata]|uniref:Uncharacterized protein n=1 Tax=Malus baccata TaxID=106549 RepID=A0A540KY19_MALBA|nr:hypothetical protein C1H46_035319 [Malus baccata]
MKTLVRWNGDGGNCQAEGVGMGGMEKGLAPATWRCCCKGYALRAIEDLDGKATIFMAGFGKKYGYGVGVLPGGKEEGREGGLCFRFTTNLCWEG